MKQTLAYILLAVALLTAACSKDKDMTKPSISGVGIAANPVNCQQYHPGDTIPFSYLFEDDTELGNYAIEVHGNFDHHSHSTESNDHDHEKGECADGHDHEHEEEEEGEEEEGVAWVFNQSYSIPSGLTHYHARQDITIPKNTKHGDYHFMVRLTDVAGWTQLKAVAIVIEE